MIIGTAGHIDHGKTTLIKALTDINTDRLEEERLRGISIDIGFAHMNLSGHQVGFIDVPGHEKFVKNMLAGIGGIQLVLLVVAADESVMPQTIEHFQICKLLGVSQGVIVLTKKNLVDENLLSLAEIEILELVQGSSLENSPVVAVDSLSGEGIKDLKNILLHQIQKIKQTAFEFRKNHQVLHLPIDRVFAMRGFGTIVTGTLGSGSIKKNDLITLYPSAKTARVRGIQIFNQQSSVALAGQRTALNLVGLQKEEIDRGMVISYADTVVPSSMVDAIIHLLPDSPRALKQHSSIRFHHGSSELIGRVYLLEQNSLSPGDSTLAQIRLDSSTVCRPKDPFILRHYSPMTTIGGGVVLDAHPTKHRKNNLEQVLAGLKRLHKMQEKNNTKINGALLEYIVQSDGSSGTTLSQLVVRTGFVGEYILSLLKTLPDLVSVSQNPVLVVSKKNLTKLKKEIGDFLRDFHINNPLAIGVSKEELKERFLNKSTSSYLQFVLELLEEEKQINLEGTQVSLYGREVTLTEEQKKIKKQLLKLFKRKILQVPNLEELTQKLAHNPKQVQNIFYFLLENGELVRISKNLVLSPDQIHSLQSQLRNFFPNKQKFSVAQFKDLFKITRKYAIPLLEFLDRGKITQRIGDKRLVL